MLRRMYRTPEKPNKNRTFVRKMYRMYGKFQAYLLILHNVKLYIIILDELCHNLGKMNTLQKFDKPPLLICYNLYILYILRFS